MEWNDAILDLKNVGEQRAKKLNRLGIQTIGDLLEHYPRDYKDRSRMVTIADLSETEENTFVARVRGEGQSVRRGRLGRHVVYRDGIYRGHHAQGIYGVPRQGADVQRDAALCDAGPRGAAARA